MLNKIASAIYRAEIEIKGTNRVRFTAQRCMSRLRQLILRFSDPVVRMKIGDRVMTLPLSHRAPQLLADNPYYDQVLARLIRFMKGLGGDDITVVDVGANVGDTAQIIVAAGAAKVISIEGDPEYFGYLQENWRDDDRVVCVKAMLSDRSDLGLSTKHYAGTAFVVEGGEAGGVRTLDDVIDDIDPGRIDILKTDTDGFDVHVLRGASKLISRDKPAIFFEFSPEHTEKIGGEDPMIFFSMLAALDYDRFIVYDSGGCIILDVRVEAQDVLRQMTRYALIKGLYYDVLALPRENGERFEPFAAAEAELFPKFNRPYLPAYADAAL